MFDCNRGFKEEDEEEEILDEVCLKSLKEEIFGKLSDTSIPEDDLYDHFKQHIYKPLALKSVKKENMSDTLYDLMNPKESLLEDINFSTNYGVLAKYLMKNFDTLLNLDEKMIGNKGFIQQKVSKILQTMHLFWNVLRKKNQVDKARVDTKKLLTLILEKYSTRQSAVFSSVKKLVTYIQSAYERFIKAHQVFMMMNRFGDNVISHIIIQRYKWITVKFA